MKDVGGKKITHVESREAVCSQNTTFDYAKAVCIVKCARFLTVFDSGDK